MLRKHPFRHVRNQSFDTGGGHTGLERRSGTKGNEEVSERKRKEEEGKERGKKGRNAAMCAKRGGAGGPIMCVDHSE